VSETAQQAGAPERSDSHAAAAEGRAILTRDLGKAYRLYDKPFKRFLDLVLPGDRSREFWALKSCYLDIPKGSTVGVIGENGAGKSTLLKLLSGITRPTKGELHVEGRVASLIELGAGFHPEFSGRDNIGLACSILGLTREETAEKVEPIIAFSELGDFIDRPVKNYSSGMYLRLGFSVATCLDPDVLLVDEALSVGDEHFRGKCLNRLNEFREQGGTTVFVSHDLGSVKSMCQHVVLLDRGEVIEQGAPEKVADEYLKRVKARGEERLSMLHREASDYPRWGSGEIEVEDVRMLDEDGEASHVVQPGARVTYSICWKATEDCAEPVFGLGIYRADGSYLNGSNHDWRDEPIAIRNVRAGETGEVRMEVERLPLLAGQYYVTAFVYDHGKASPTAIDHYEHALGFEVVDAHCLQHGLVRIPSAWVVSRTAPGGGEPDVTRSES
jgi:ABC-type polysaccharide/polyol phosphate transport system ATPase subunit